MTRRRSVTEAGELRKRIQEGEAFDAVAIELLLPSGKISSDSVVKIAHSDLRIGMRKDAPKPDTSTAEALKRLLLDVKGTTYTDPKSGGVSWVLFVNKLGIAEEVHKQSK